MGLQGEIDAARKDIRTDSYTVSIGEWISIYEKRELDIHPEFQRFFRWSPTQKSRLIESLLLGIPVPPIFVAQRHDGIWDVVDGLQRLSTVYQFVGLLRDEEKRLVDPLVLEGTEYLPSLNGRMWDSAAEPEKSLEPAQRLLIKRAKIDVSIILRESEERAKYELFQRLNTGGSQLSDQEVRNAILVMINRDFYQWLLNLSRYGPFVESTALSDRALDERYDMELALRFVVLRSLPEDALIGIADLGDFLTAQARKLAEDQAFPRGAEEQAFRDTFDLISSHLGSDAFRRYDPIKTKHVGGFLVSAFEAVALGIGVDPATSIKDGGELRARAQGIWDDEGFTGSAGSGVRAGSRIPKVVPLGRKRFRV